MKNKINELIKDYKLDVEGMFIGNHSAPEHYKRFEISISLGTNEGYYVDIYHELTSYHLRTHSKDEALKILGVMLHLLPNN